MGGIVDESLLFYQGLVPLESYNDSDPVPGTPRSNAGKTLIVTTQTIIAVSIGLTSFLLFCFLRPRWHNLFAPRTRLKGISAPDLLPPSFFGWVSPLLKMSESEVLERVGLDAAVLLAFFKMSAKLFATCCIFAYVFIVPIDIYERKVPRNGNGSLFGGDDGEVNIPEDQSAPRIFVYALFTWVFSLLSFYFMYHNYTAFTKVRQDYYLKLKDTMVARTVMVSVIPKKLQDDKALAEWYESLGLGNVQSAVVCRHVRRLRHAIERRTYHLRKLEEAYTKWLANPCTDPIYDPEEVLDELEGYRSPNEHNANEAGLLLETGPLLSKISRPRPTFRDGFLHIFGKKIDLIDYYTKKFNYYDNLVELGRNGSYTTTSVGFVTFYSMESAQIAAQTLNAPEPFSCQTALAPEPRDIYWQNINLRERELIVRKVLIYIIFVILVFAWTFPIATLAAFLDLATLSKIFPWLARLAEKNQYVKAFIQGTLPTLVVVVFNTILPYLLDYMSKVQGLQSRSRIELSLQSKFFIFLLMNTLLTFTIGNAAFQLFLDIIQNPTGIANILASTLPKAAPFFVNLVVLEGMAIYPLQLLQLGDICSALFQRTFIAKTPRDYAEAMAPPFLNYGMVYPRAVLIFVIILVYSAISPNILFFGAIYFFLGYFIYKYLLLFVYFHPYESAGQAWPLIFLQVFVGLSIFQLMMFGFLTFKKSYALASSILPLYFVTWVFLYYTKQAFDKSSAFIPLKLIQEAEKKSPSSTAETTGDAPPTQATLEPPNTEDAPSTQATLEPPELTRVSTSQKHQQILNDDLYHAEADIYTDYTQPPMNLYPGVLNTGMKQYGPPALTGVLPWIWLPVKKTKEGQESSPGFWMRLLGMHKSNQSYTTSDEERPILEQNSQSAADERISQQDQQIQEDPTNPHRVYYHHPELRGLTLKEAAKSSTTPVEVPSTASTSEAVSSNLQRRDSKSLLENWAGNNFGDSDGKHGEGDNTKSSGSGGV